MRPFARSLTIVLLLALLVACTSLPKPTDLPKPSQTSPSTSTATPRPTAATSSAKPTLPEPTLPPSSHLSPAIKMTAGRAAHTATLLPDGKVLIVGGFREEGTSEVPVASAEIYDPDKNTFTPTADLNEARDGHTATLLPNGKVLVVGGWSSTSRKATAELYDPQTGHFSFTTSLAAPRQGMTATLLNDGRVLIAGGDSARDAPQLIAEIYDPVTDTFTQTGSLNRGRSSHTATLLQNGDVLLVGGVSQGGAVLASAEIYHPATGSFTLTGNMSAVRYKHAAVLLQDGDVLVIGGSDQNDWRGKYTSAEIYNPQTGAFTKTADLNKERFKLADAAVLLPDGNVLIGGGNRQIEVFDAQRRRFLLSDTLDNDYFFSVLTLLRNGQVLITGGYDSSIHPTDQAWIYN